MQFPPNRLPGTIRGLEVGRTRAARVLTLGIGRAWPSLQHEG